VRALKRLRAAAVQEAELADLGGEEA
jgi:hypothetical protein